MARGTDSGPNRGRKDGEWGIQEITKLTYQHLRRLYGPAWPKNFYNEDIRLVMRIFFWCMLRESLKGKRIVIDTLGTMRFNWSRVNNKHFQGNVYRYRFTPSRKISRMKDQEDIGEVVAWLDGKIKGAGLPLKNHIRREKARK